MSEKTKIKGGYIIAFDGARHRYLREGELVYEGDTIAYVGKGYEGKVDQTIDARESVVSPGFVCTHAHLAASPLDRSFLEDRGSPQFYYSGLYEYLPILREVMDPEMYRACLAYSLAELLRGGTTTAVELGRNGQDLLSLIPLFGNRVYYGHMVRSGQWYTDGRQVLYGWDKDGGREAMDQAFAFTQEHDGDCGGLLRCLLSPAQVDTCSEELLLKTQEEAKKRGLPVTLHTSQSVNEFQEMLRRHGKTPVAWLRDIGFLQQNVILGHAIIVGGTSWTNYPPGDLEIMAQSGCSVAHSPWVFGRRGIAMESFFKYQTAGINMSLGTDTCPQNMIQAMRWSAVLSKLMERRTDSTVARDVFDAATLGGAKALGREDLGRLCPGAKADIVLFSGRSMNMVPLRDPVKNIVYNAEMEDVESVIVGGKIVVEKGRLKGVDEAELTRKVQDAGSRMWPRMAAHDRAGRSVDELSPLTFDPWEG